ncbi:NB-ARC domain-containing protein [Streptomyces sp. ID05-26A]|nr:NB-ARC domain-containing protein [Streptomyces sp. ID05-26A]
MGETFAERLRGYRIALGLTQQALAEKAQLSEQAVGALERGDRRYPQAVTVDRLAGVFGLTGAERQAFVQAASRKGKPRVCTDAVVPRQLPADVAHFTGRSGQASVVAAALRSPATAAVVAVTGMGGVGKTSLAVHVGHLVAGDFPDGQLYLDLRGHSGRAPVAPLEALGVFLRALGLAGTALPATVDEAAARLRTELAGRRMLLVLDNVADEEQVAPLLPGTAGTAAIVTSRQAVLVAQARQVRLDVLPEADAITLLALTAGAERVLAEPGAAAEVVRRCGWLPLAVRLAGARLAARPGWSAAALAARLADAGRRLDELDGVRVCFAHSIDGLAGSDDPVDRAAAAAYPVLAWPDLPDLSVLVAARLLDVGEAEAERVLERLTAACLLEAPAPGRYRMHDLLRVYGAGMAGPGREVALARVLRLYNAVAWRGLALANRGSPRLKMAADVGDAPDLPDPWAWLETERAHVVAAVAQAGSGPVPLLAVGLFEFYRTRGLWRDWQLVCEKALSHPADDLVRAYLLCDLGVARAELAHRGAGDHRTAQEHIRTGLALFEEHGDGHATARALNNACYVFRLGGAVEEAIEFGERALALQEELGDRGWTHGLTLVNLAELRGLAGDREARHRHLTEALAVLEPLDDAHGLAYALVVLGLAQRAEGHLEEAAGTLTRSAAQWRRIADAPGEANTLTDLGDTLLRAGRPEAAREALIRAGALMARIGDPKGKRRVADLLSEVPERTV